MVLRAREAERAFDGGRRLFLYWTSTRVRCGPFRGKPMTTYEYLNLIIASLNLVAAYAGLGLIFHGIRTMDRNAAMRADDSERKHHEVMTESDRRHNEAMTESRRRHEESMTSLRELIDGQAESRMALRELIERTR